MNKKTRGWWYYRRRWLRFCLRRRMLYPFRKWRAAVDRLDALQAADLDLHRRLHADHYREGLWPYPPEEKP